MPIAASDIGWYLSQGNTAAQTTSTANASLGGTRSTSTFPDATLNALFDDVTSAENAAGDTEYRMVYIVNNHATLTASNLSIYMTDPAGGGTMAIGLDPAAVTADSTTTVANENTAPTGVTFSTAAVSDATGLTIPSLAPGQRKGIWVRRVIAANTTSTPSDSVTLSVSFDTP